MDWTTGSIVRLQSGGPPMTVAEIKGEMARCAWYWRGEYHSDWFDGMALCEDEPGDAWDETEPAEMDS